MSTFENQIKQEVEEISSNRDYANLSNDAFSLENQYNIQVVSTFSKEKILKSTDCMELNTYNDYYFDYSYVEFSNGGCKLLISNSEQSFKEPIFRPTVINQRKELCKYFFDLLENEAWINDFKNDTILRDKILIEIVTLANMQKLFTDKKNDVIREYFFNSQLAYQSIAAKTFCENFKPEVFWVTEDNYDQTDHFGWLYAAEVSQLVQLLDKKQHGRVKVLDDATGFGHFIFTCAHLLDKEQLDRVDFLGTDYKMKDMLFAREYSTEIPCLHSQWMLEDINKEGHFERLLALNGGECYDLTVVNHVIEHLNAKPLKEYLADWLSVTNTLIISVPFEDSLENSVSSHFHLFDENILTQLGQELADSHDGRIAIDTSFVEGGLIIFHKCEY